MLTVKEMKDALPGFDPSDPLGLNYTVVNGRKLKRMRGGAVAAPAAPRAGAPAAPLPQIPFVNAAHEHTEPAFSDTQAITAAAGVDKGPFDIPAYGYLRHILLECSFAGGTLGAGVLAADAPWNIFERITLSDVNGSPIFELDGYAALQANIIGGYAFNQDPRLMDHDGTINGRFYLRIPVEINHFNGLGAISNQNSASQYKLTYRLRAGLGAVNAGLFSTAPTTYPTLTVRGFLEAWSLPNETDLGGRPQEQYPPMHGTSQYWQSNSKGILVGANTIGITKVGNLIRNIILIARDATGARADTVFPDPVSLDWDGNTLQRESQRGHIIRLKEKLHQATRDTGVFCYPFAHSELGRNGDGPASLWLGTVQSARLEVSGNSAAAGSIQVVMNDVAPVEVVPSERYETPNRTGYAPNTVGAVRNPVA